MMAAVSPEVICQPVTEGAVLFHTGTETYFGLNEAGLKVWMALESGPETVQAVYDAVCAAYPDAEISVVRRDVDALIDELTSQGLLVRTGAR